MVAVDTNVLLRFIMADDLPQHQLSYKLFKNEEIFVSDTVLLEAEWVMRAVYRQSSSQVVHAFRNVAGLASVNIESLVELESALKWHEQGMDFADAFHVARVQHLDEFITFDQRFIKRAERIISSCKIVELTKKRNE